MTGSDSRFSIRGQSSLRILIPPLSALIGLTAALSFFGDSAEQSIPRDADLCPTDAELIAGSAVFLFDFSKPLQDIHATRPGDLLGNVIERLPNGTALEVFSLASSPAAPRKLLKRLCKPFGGTGLEKGPRQADGEGQSAEGRLCSEVGAESAPGTDETVAPFCAVRHALQDELNTLVGVEFAQRPSVANAYLVEALEDIRLDFAGRPQPHLLYLFSDMMQHSSWYSHLDLRAEDWNFVEFVESLASRNWYVEPRNGFADIRVELFYVPRLGATDRLTARQRHQSFWRKYFAGADIAVHDQSPMPGYESSPLMNVLTASELATQERKALQRTLRELQREREALTQEQRQLEAARQRQVED